MRIASTKNDRRKVNRAPQHQVRKRRLDHDAARPRVALQREFVRNLERIVVLPQSERQVQRTTRARARRDRPPVTDTQQQGNYQYQREQRIDDRDNTPGYARVAEWPQQVRAIAGTGIEQPAGGVTEQGKTVKPTKRETLAQQWPQDRGGNQRTDRNKHQRVAEMPVKLDVEQRVVAGANQDIGIGQQAGGKANPAATRASAVSLPPAPACRRVIPGSAGPSVGYRSKLRAGAAARV